MTNQANAPSTRTLVERNPFRGVTFAGQQVPSFLTAKESLPVPILPDHAGWVEMYWRAWELAWARLRRPSQESVFIANYMGAMDHSSLFIWDACFSSLFGVYARPYCDFAGSLENFYARQHADGFICRQLELPGGQDAYHAYHPDGTGPNILAWTEWRLYRASGDEERLTRIFWPLMAYHRWCRANRSWPSGSYWGTGQSSGIDKPCRVPKGTHHHRHYSWVDATLQAALSASLLGKMATLLHEEELAAELGAEHEELVRVTNGELWNERAGFYQDCDRHGRHNDVKSIASYWALLDEKVVPSRRLAPFLQHLRDDSAFGRPHMVPSQSVDSAGCSDETGEGWHGGVWPATNFMLLKGLRTVGKSALAHQIAMNHLSNVWQIFRRTDTFWEYYEPERPVPGDSAHPDSIVGTGVTPIAMLLEDVIGLSADWPQRQVVWDRHLSGDGQWGVRNYPLGTQGRLDLLGDSKRIQVTTNTPFTLTIHDHAESISAAVSAGSSEIDLSD